MDRDSHRQWSTTGWDCRAVGLCAVGVVATLPADDTPVHSRGRRSPLESDEVEFLPFPRGWGGQQPDDDIIPVVPIPDEFVAEDIPEDEETPSDEEEGADEIVLPKDDKPSPRRSRKTKSRRTSNPPTKKTPIRKKTRKETGRRQSCRQTGGQARRAAPCPQPAGAALRETVSRTPPARPEQGGREEARSRDSRRRNDSQKAQDTHGPRSAHRPRRRKLQWLSSAEQSVAEGDWNEAVKWYQQILDHADDALHKPDNGDWLPLKRFVRRTIATGPSALRETYRTQFDGLAKRLWDDANRRGDETELARLAASYFPTEAGQLAANRVGTLALDRGEMALAARWFDELWSTRAVLTRDRKWRLKALVALDRAKLDSAKEVLAALAEEGPPPPATNDAAKRPGSAAWLAELSAGWPAWSAPVLTDWLVPFGDAGRTAGVEGGDPLLIPRWSSALTDSHPVREQVEHLVQSLQDQDLPTLPAAHTLLVNGRIAFRTLAGSAYSTPTRGVAVADGRRAAS